MLCHLRIMRPQFTALAFTLHMACASLPAATPTTIDKVRFLDLLDAAVQSIRTYELHIESTYEMFIDARPTTRTNGRPDGWQAATLTKPNVMLSRSRQLLGAGRYRLEPALTLGQKNADIIVGDFEIERTYGVQARQSEIRQPSPVTLPYGLHYFEMYRSVRGVLSIAYVLRERDNVRVSIESGSGRLMATSEPCPGRAVSWQNSGFRIALDPGAGMLPVLIETVMVVNDRRLIQHRLTITDFKKLLDGTSVPTKAVTEFFWTAADSHLGKLSGRQETIVDVNRSRWNVNINERRFDLSLPAGVRVFDRIRNVAYVTGKPDPGKNLDELAANARQVIRLNPTFNQLPTMGLSWWAAGGAVTLLAAIMLTLLLRRFHTRRPVS